MNNLDKRRLLDKRLKEVKERLDRLAIGFGLGPSYFSKENIEKRERTKEIETIKIRKEIEQELRKEYEKNIKYLLKNIKVLIIEVLFPQVNPKLIVYHFFHMKVLQ